MCSLGGLCCSAKTLRPLDLVHFPCKMSWSGDMLSTLESGTGFLWLASPKQMSVLEDHAWKSLPCFLKLGYYLSRIISLGHCCKAFYKVCESVMQVQRGGIRNGDDVMVLFFSYIQCCSLSKLLQGAKCIKTSSITPEFFHQGIISQVISNLCNE